MLKKKIVETMQQSFPGISPSISDWKGQDIVNFQEELLQHVNAHISEKWFYTHMKSEGGKLPRIDVLNLLSKYVGYADWNDFIFKNGAGKIPVPGHKSGNRYFIMIPLLVLGVLALFFLFNKIMSTKEYTFCFYDADTKEPIANEDIEVSLILENESPVNYLCDPGGCFNLKTDRSYVQLAVRSPYYRNDTVRRTLRKFNPEETIGLHANDYALMLRYFSEMNVQDWQKRRQKLEEIFAENAVICQVLGKEKQTGVELYSRSEFIDKLTIPSESLKNIEILDTKYIGGRIAVLRFRTSATAK